MTSTVGLVSPFSPPADAIARERCLGVSCRLAMEPDERALHARIRREVFVAEQGLFDGDDVDARDGDPATRHALGLYGSVVAGVVRFYPLDEPGLWKGDRLAVLRPFRRHHLGPPLVEFAVRTAGELGGSRMIAYVQPPNVGLFERLGWHRVGPVTSYVGHPHQQMAIPLR